MDEVWYNYKFDIHAVFSWDKKKYWLSEYVCPGLCLHNPILQKSKEWVYICKL